MKKIFGLAALVFSSQLQAQTDSAASLNPVVITATKFPLKQSQTGKVISVITKEQIDKSAGRTVAQLLNEQAGLTVNGALNTLGSNQTLYMRGAPSGRTLILLDGVPVNDPSLINNEFDLNLISLSSVERIEVCRGAQSTLYGSDAIAGVINIITQNDNAPKPFGGKVTASAGNYGTFRGNVQVHGQSGKWKYTTRYGKLVSNGFSAAYDSTGIKNFEADGYNSDVASAAVHFSATQHLTFRGFVQYSRYNNDLDAGVFADEKDFTIQNKSKIAGGGFHYQKDNVSLRGNYQYSDISRGYRNDSLDTPGFAKFSTDDFFGQNQFVELYSSIGLAKGFTLLQGADYRYNSMHSELLSISSFGPYKAAFRDTAHSQSSLYTSLYYQSGNEKLNIELGGRLNVHSRYGNNYTYTFNPSYQLLPSLRIFGNIATGFKAPTLYQLFSSYGRQDLAPEQSKTVEGGMQFLSGNVRSRAVYFQRTIEDGLDFNYVSYKYYNFLRQDVNGVELETTWQPARGLSFTGNYTFLSSEETSQSRSNFKDTTYSYLLRRPRHSVNVTAGYQWMNGPVISVSGKYVSSRFDVGGYKKPDVMLDAYFLLNLYAEYNIRPKVKLFTDIQNITGTTFFDVRGYNSIPFLINAGVTFSW